MVFRSKGTYKRQMCKVLQVLRLVMNQISSSNPYHHETGFKYINNLTFSTPQENTIYLHVVLQDITMCFL